MKPLILGAAILGIVFVPVAAEAKGCIKGAIVGGIAGHMAGHGKVGAVAGCIIGRALYERTLTLADALTRARDGT